jgi:high frequency lysogenization protein
MNNTNTDRALAIAGVIQATHCVKEIGVHGQTDAEALRSSIESIFTVNAETTLDVYGGLQNLRHGIEYALQLFSADNKALDLEIMQYTIGILQLERKLSKKPAMLNALAVGIEKAKQQAGIFSTTHDNVLANLAGLYSDTISTLSPRIMVQGEASFLNDTQNIHKIRALLLSAIRSAVLWRQKGGNRWQIMFSRKKYVAEFQSLIEKLNMH